MLFDSIRQVLCDIRIYITRFDAVFELLLPQFLLHHSLPQLKLGDDYFFTHPLTNPWLRLRVHFFHHFEISHLHSRIFAKNLPVGQEELYDQILHLLGSFPVSFQLVKELLIVRKFNSFSVHDFDNIFEIFVI